MSDSFDARLADGIAQLLDDAGTLSADWSDTTRPAYMRFLLRDGANEPAAAVAIKPYPVSDDPTQATSTVGIQIRTRAPGDDVAPDATADRIFDALHGLWSHDLTTGIHLTRVWRQSGAPIGQDAEGRWVRSDNYYSEVGRPGPHRS